jgi:hypothetical protein
MHPVSRFECARSRARSSRASRNWFLQRRRDALAVILDRAQTRGELPVGVSAGTITDIVFGVIWYRILATGQAPGNKLAGELTTALAGPPSGSGEPALHPSRRKRT